MNGFIYVMSNPSYKNERLKIGISKHDPTSQRVIELYSTGVPEPFKVEYYAFVENYEAAEKIVHSTLDNKRPNKDREFFTCSVPEAIIAIRNHTKIKYEEIIYKSPEQIEKKQRAKQERERIEKAKLEKEHKERENQSKKEAEERQRREQIENTAKLDWIIIGFLGMLLGMAALIDVEFMWLLLGLFVFVIISLVLFGVICSIFSFLFGK